jgi:hypothetical protein
MRHRLKRLHAGGMWKWLFDSLDRAITRHDTQRLMLAQLLMLGGEGIEGEFDRGIDFLQRGRALAEHLDEHWWMVLFDHWRLQILRRKGDFPLARELIMHLVAEVRKPRYEGLPLRVCIQEDLIQLCMDTDPFGYTPRIEQAMRAMEASVIPGTTCALCLWGLRVDFNKALHRWDAMEVGVNVLVRLNADQPDSLAVDYTNLCRLAYERGDRVALAEYLRIGADLARRGKKHECLAEFQAWQAFLAVEADRPGADRLAEASLTESKQVIGLVHADYYDAICTYFEAAGNLDRALDLRFSQLNVLSGSGRLGQEMHCRAEICRLLIASGKPARNQIAAARKATRGLIDPAPMLSLLDRLDRGAAGA